MRLEADLVPRLVAELRQVYGADAEVWLFGSRVDDQARGGDIDLYVETADDSHCLDRYLESRQRLFRLFGDRKVDLNRAIAPATPLPDRAHCPQDWSKAELNLAAKLGQTLPIAVI